ncbi:MAG TPA: cell wall-active antibiotics response protein LiaF [Virgibacillus sp.]|nr:cell wall-active antibiotics response protein LiaF [Virgibacillus sp.]
MSNNVLRYFTAVLLIGLGTMLVLDNLGIIESNFNEAWHFIYPSFFIIFGIVLLFKYVNKSGGNWMFGSFIIIFGSMLWLGRLAVIEFQFADLFKLWPLLIIYVGFSLFGLTNRWRKPRVHIINDKHKHSYQEFGKRFSIGDVEFKEENWRVEPLNLWNAAGDYYLDFSKAYIPEEEIPIRIDSWAGDIQILLPENIDVRIAASVKAGEINLFGRTADGINCDLHFETPGYDEAVRKLDIELDLKAGSIKVYYV